MRGKVDRSLADIVAFKQQWENAKASLRFRVIHVRTNRRYVLVSVAPLAR